MSLKFVQRLGGANHNFSDLPFHNVRIDLGRLLLGQLERLLWRDFLLDQGLLEL